MWHISPTSGDLQRCLNDNSCGSRLEWRWALVREGWDANLKQDWWRLITLTDSSNRSWNERGVGNKQPGFPLLSQCVGSWGWKGACKSRRGGRMDRLFALIFGLAQQQILQSEPRGQTSESLLWIRIICILHGQNLIPWSSRMVWSAMRNIISAFF